MNHETVFTLSPSPIKFGPGALHEIGQDAKRLGMRRVALFTDPWVSALPCLQQVSDALKASGLDPVIYDACQVEPTDKSFLQAAEFARDGRFDGYISLGGGSVMDTAKAASLYATYPDDLLTYVNAPVGTAKPVPGPLPPHIACPTTSGTGAECTGIAIFDLTDRQLKTGIASPLLKPSLGIVDPITTLSLPPLVIASTGVDVLVHALESYTAIRFDQRPAPADVTLRPPAQGGNPHSDIGALEALRLGGAYLVRAVKDADDREARYQLMWAATLAGTAFGNAGVHIPHAMSYAVASLKKQYTPADYPTGKPLVPHGISVIVNAPAAVRFTASSSPQRHLQAASALGVDTHDTDPSAAGELLAGKLIELMRDTGIPNGIEPLGYTPQDIPELVKRTYAQQRLLKNAPLPVTEGHLAQLFAAALNY